MHARQLPRRSLTPLLCLLLLLSGMAGLIYETAWTRLFQELFGHDVHTTAAVLAGYMAGLGLGAVIGGRLADRRRNLIRLYGWLELGVALIGLASPLQLAAADRLLPMLLGPLWASPGPGDAVRWAVAAVLLLVPTTLMGATLPLLCRAVIDEERAIGSSFALLYGINTIGAVCGVLLAGFWLIRSLGVVGTIRTGCLLSLAAGLGGLLLGRLTREPDPAPGSRAAPMVGAADPTLKLTLVVILLSGVTTLAYEVIWIRFFVFLTGSNILSFSLVLAALLASIAIGSLLLPVVVRRRGYHLRALGWLEIGLGFGAALTVPLFLNIDTILHRLAGLGLTADPLASLGGRALITVLLVLVPGLLMGAVLPAATGAVRSADTAGRGIGLLYGATTIGNIAGSLVAGYLLIPRLGCSRSLLLLAGINAALGVVVLSSRRWHQRPVASRAALVLLAACLLVLPATLEPGSARLWQRQTPHATLVHASEGLRGTVTVHDLPPLPLLSRNRERHSAVRIGYGYRLIAVDGVDVAGTAPDLRTTQKVQADIPLLLHGAAHQVLQIGYGSGETSLEVGRHPGTSLHLVEINPAVVAHANRWFPAFAGGRFAASFTDAKTFVRTSSQRFDVILNDSTYPGISGSSQLYSQDHLLACRAHLRPGGMLSTWLPIDLPPETFRMVLATFRSVFPHCSFWLATSCWNKHGVLVGSLQPQDRAWRRLRTGPWPAAVSASLAEVGLGDPEVLAAARVLDTTGITALTRGVKVSSDDHPYLEYPVHGVQVSGEQFWHETLQLIISRLARSALDAGRGGTRSAAGAPVPLLLAGQLALLEDDAERALRFYNRAGRLWPEHPGAATLSGDINVFRAQAALDEALGALASGEAGAALDALQSGVRLCPFSAVLQFELGRLLVRLGRHQEAAPHLQRCLALSDEIPEAAELLAQVRAGEQIQYPEMSDSAG